MDQCMNCLYRGNISSCLATECHKHDDWIVKELRKSLSCVDDLIRESYGVVGLHLNGDIVPWDDLRTGGRFEEWLIDFDAALNTSTLVPEE